MSSWFVMSSLGLFQTDGGCRVNPIYEIGSPLYPKIVLHLSKEHYGGKTFTIEARHASRANTYIQSAMLNGQPLRPWASRCSLRRLSCGPPSPSDLSTAKNCSRSAIR
jgi:putative alpha-1,2-mannosidase